LCFRIKKPPEKLRIQLYLDKNDLFDDVTIDGCTMYAAHREKSAFTVKEYSILYYPKIKNRVKYAPIDEEESSEPPGGEALKEAENFIFSTIKKVISMKTLKSLFSVLDIDSFRRAVYERGRAIEDANLLLKDHVYVEEFIIDKPADIFDLPEKKLHEIIIERGEKSLEALIIFYRVRETGDMISFIAYLSNFDREVIDLRKYQYKSD
jgi:hypothetical protein